MFFKSNWQCIKVYILSADAFPRTQTHDDDIAGAMLYSE